MSYTNHSAGHGVYTYFDIGGYYYCGDCAIKNYSTDDFIKHLKYHQSQGCNIPPDVFDNILNDKEENDLWIKSKLPQ